MSIAFGCNLEDDNGLPKCYSMENCFNCEYSTRTKIVNEIQRMNDDMVKKMGFVPRPDNLVCGLFAECGEVADLVARLNRWKKVKSTDINVDKLLLAELELEIADVLVYLGQIATLYGIDMEEALEKKISIIEGRKFHE